MLLSVSQVIESGVLPRDVGKFRILRCISANLVKSGGALRFGLIETNRGPAYKVEVSQVYFGSLSLLLRFGASWGVGVRRDAGLSFGRG